MKKIIIIIGIVLLLLIAAIIGIVIFKKPASVVNNPATSFPVSSSTSGSVSSGNLMTVTLQDGSSIQINDFIHNGETVADVENEGIYFLAGSVGYCLYDGTCPAGAKSDQYTVSYDSKTQIFTLALLAEPLGASRLAGEKFLTDHLGLTKLQLCTLRYVVLVSNSVNESYSDISNLGFSSCQGATKLP